MNVTLRQITSETVVAVTGPSVRPEQHGFAAANVHSGPARGVRCVCALALATAFAAPSQAETLRCSGGSAAEGDSRASVLYKCGQPALKDSFCAPLYYGPNFQLVPEPWAGTVLPCQSVDEWLYERGPGNMVATLRFRAGVLQSIRYGRSPR